MFSKRFYLVLAIILTILLGTVVILSAADEISTLFNSWLEGKPRMLVKLEITLPQVDADRCVVIIKRFPTAYNPTEDGYTESIYEGVHTPGATLVAKNTLFAHVVKYRLDPRTNEYVVDYYEPQEYVIFVNCVKDNTTVFEWAKIVEVFPRSIIHTEKIEVKTERAEIGSDLIHNLGDGGEIENTFSCDIVIVKQRNDYKKGECYTWVRGPPIYSIQGLNTSFVLHTYPRSAVYLEGFSNTKFAFRPIDESQVQWGSAGKKLTPSVISRETMGLAGYYKATIYFYVRYQYEYAWYCSSIIGGCITYWLLYPTDILSVARSCEDPMLPCDLQSYTPPTPPYYRVQGSLGETLIWFNGTSETDIPLSSITVGFTYAGVWTASLNVDFYKAVRNDTQYTAPAIRINATRYYWWWYKDNDPRNYEILVAPRYP